MMLINRNLAAAQTLLLLFSVSAQNNSTSLQEVSDQKQEQFGHTTTTTTAVPKAVTSSELNTSKEVSTNATDVTVMRDDVVEISSEKDNTASVSKTLASVTPTVTFKTNVGDMGTTETVTSEMTQSVNNKITTPDHSADTASVLNSDTETTTPFRPYDRQWIDYFLRSHHFQGQYAYLNEIHGFDFIVRSAHPEDSRTLVTYFHDSDGAVLEMNGTSIDGQVLVFKLVRIFTPGRRFPLNSVFEITGMLVTGAHGKYFSGNVTKPGNSTFSWIHMTKGLGVIETGESAGTRTAIIITIPTTIAFLGICGTVVIICWASKKGYLRGRHKSYRLFTNTQVSYESEAETIHI